MTQLWGGGSQALTATLSGIWPALTLEASRPPPATRLVGTTVTRSFARPHADVCPHEDALGLVPHEDALGLVPHEDALGLVPNEDALGLVPHEDALGFVPHEDALERLIGRRDGRAMRPVFLAHALGQAPCEGISDSAIEVGKSSWYEPLPVAAERNKP